MSALPALSSAIFFHLPPAVSKTRLWPVFFAFTQAGALRGKPSLYATAKLHTFRQPVRALIVEDSREDLLNLRALLEQVPEIEIVGEAHTLGAALAAATETTPGVVFLDIELGPHNGFDLLEHLPDATRVIFTTVHTGYGANAFDVNATDYLVKPITEDRLLRALAKLRSPEAAPLTKVQVYRGGGERHRLALEAVAAIIADRDYSKVICGSREYTDHRRFSEWSELLADQNFAQLDRSTLVRLDLVHTWQPFGAGLKLKLRNSPVELELGRAAAKRFAELSPQA